ncbi:MAG: pyridoxine 5'-phosphate synthase [Pseudomonadales bacterium]|jgi:pyridoxine 5-phosphate synthase|nr:pyridoxine 5'-phosphate synthase [Pseudomonadales bacterium]
MTALSLNLNKLALLRNSRGRNYPDLLSFAERFIALGVDGLTIHPRPDQRHIRRDDVYALAEFLQNYPHIEYNIEGYPSGDFLSLIREVKPTQCTLVPDAEAQLTSDHGWDCRAQAPLLREVVADIKAHGVRCAVFLDPDPEQAPQAAALGADRIELYTEAYAAAHGTPRQAAVLADYVAAAARARECGLGVNAGHDLSLANLGDFLAIGGILEVSIGHALTVECIELGMNTVIPRYLALCHGAP